MIASFKRPLFAFILLGTWTISRGQGLFLDIGIGGIATNTHFTWDNYHDIVPIDLAFQSELSIRYRFSDFHVVSNVRYAQASKSSTLTFTAPGPSIEQIEICRNIQSISLGLGLGYGARINRYRKENVLAIAIIPTLILINKVSTRTRSLKGDFFSNQDLLSPKTFLCFDLGVNYTICLFRMGNKNLFYIKPNIGTTINTMNLKYGEGVFGVYFSAGAGILIK